jgi:hypothetical protein
MNITKFFQQTDGYYYKIVTPSSWFADCVNCNMDILNIPNGTIFTAPEIPKNYVFYPEGLVSEYGFHFAQGAFDTMLWHNTLCWQVPFSIYKVKPIGDVKKERCHDGDGLYQCCATGLRFLEKQDVGKMYDAAVAEYIKNPHKYPNIEVDIDAWRMHQITINILLEPYCRY